MIEKPNADDPFEVEEVKEYLLSNAIDASKDSLFELITFTAGRLYYDEKHPYQAAARVKLELINLKEAVHSNSGISRTELERCLQRTEVHLTSRHQVSQIAAVQETFHPDLVELKSFIEKRLALIVCPTEETTKEQQQRKGEEFASQSAPTPDELRPYLLILSPMQTRLYNTLSEYTPEEYHETLAQLLETGRIEGGSRVWIKLRADSLAYIFKQARETENAPISAGMTETAVWLCPYPLS